MLFLILTSIKIQKFVQILKKKEKRGKKKDKIINEIYGIIIINAIVITSVSVKINLFVIITLIIIIITVESNSSCY